MSALWKRLRKRARRNIGNVGWGDRHLLTLWLPRSAYPAQEPTMPPHLVALLGTLDPGFGYTRDLGGGTTARVVLNTHSGEPRAWTYPTPADPDAPMPADAVPHGVEDAGWEWLAEVAAVRRQQARWHDDVHSLAWCSEAARVELGLCGFWSKTTYFARSAHAYGTTYAVKPWYADRFAVHAARLSRILRAEGLDARWR